MSLPSSMVDFVPCDRLLQKAYLACWIINLLLDVLLCSIAENFYSLFVF